MEENSVFQKLVIRSIPNFFSLWIVSLTLGLMGCLLLSLLPYTPDIHRSPFFHGETTHVRQQLEMLAAHKADRVAKMRARAKLENERKMFIRHAFERRKNVRCFFFFFTILFWLYLDELILVEIKLHSRLYRTT